MRVVLLLLCLGSLAACGGKPTGLQPVASGSRADGYVTMSSTSSHYNPVVPDWDQAAEDAGRRCRGWGYRDVPTFAGWQESCRVYDRHGRCVRMVVTRFYDCTA